MALEEGGIRVHDAALARIARAAEGGMRDAWSIMDMCLGYAQEDDQGLTEALVLSVLGASDRRFLFNFADMLIGSDAAGALGLIDEMMRMGREVQVFVRDVTAHLRALMLAEVCGESQAAELLEVTREDAKAYADQARRTSRVRLMRMLDLFLESETDMKWAAQPRFALESAALRACEPEESLQLEALIARVDELERKIREGVIAAAPAKAQGGKKAAPAQAPEEGAAAAQQTQLHAPQGPAPEAQRVWQETVRLLKQKPMIFGFAKQGRVATAENGLFTIVFDKTTGGMAVRMLSMDDKKQEIQQALSQAAGYPCTFRAAIEGTVGEGDQAVLAAQKEAERQRQENLGKVFDVFGRENVRVLDE